jgi:hypothetical protein
MILICIRGHAALKARAICPERVYFLYSFQYHYEVYLCTYQAAKRENNGIYLMALHVSNCCVDVKVVTLQLKRSDIHRGSSESKCHCRHHCEFLTDGENRQKEIP